MSLSNLVPIPEATVDSFQLFRESSVPMIAPIKLFVELINDEISHVDMSKQQTVRNIKNQIEDTIGEALRKLPKGQNVGFEHLYSLAILVSGTCLSAVSRIEEQLGSNTAIPTYYRNIDFSVDGLMHVARQEHLAQTSLGILLNVRYRTKNMIQSGIPHAKDLLSAQKAAML